MDVDVRVNVDDAAADRMVRVLSSQLSDLRGLWPRVEPLVRSWWKRQFETEGAFAGDPWQPLSPAYAAWKAKHAMRSGILQATGQAKRAASNPRSVRTPESLTMTIEDAGPAHGPVLQFHQEGDGVPRRPLVFGDPLPAQARAELQGVADEWVSAVISRYSR